MPRFGRSVPVIRLEEFAMKVNGPGQPPPPGVAGAESGNKPDKTATATAGRPAEPGKSFAERVSGPRHAEAAAAPAGSRATSRAGDVAVSDLAAELRAGKLSSKAAIDQVLDRVVARQIGPEAPTAVRDQIRAALQDAIEDDPLLAEKLRQLD